MIKWGVTRAAHTEYISPLVVVKKKDSSVRVCVDARKLNSKMIMDHVRPPDPCDTLYDFVRGQCLSTIDLTASYWQVPIREEDQKYVGFLHENQTYVFQVLPFGLSTSVASFIRGLNIVLGPRVVDFVFAYVDDLLIYSEDPDKHLCHLEQIFQKLREHGITVKLRKCLFARKQVDFLGLVLSSERISMDPNRFGAIWNFPTSRNVKS